MSSQTTWNSRKRNSSSKNRDSEKIISTSSSKLIERAESKELDSAHEVRTKIASQARQYLNFVSLSDNKPLETPHSALGSRPHTTKIEPTEPSMNDEYPNRYAPNSLKQRPKHIDDRYKTSTNPTSEIPNSSLKIDEAKSNIENLKKTSNPEKNCSNCFKMIEIANLEKFCEQHSLCSACSKNKTHVTFTLKNCSECLKKLQILNKRPDTDHQSINSGQNDSSLAGSNKIAQALLAITMKNKQDQEAKKCISCKIALSTNKFSIPECKIHYFCDKCISIPNYKELNDQCENCSKYYFNSSNLNASKSNNLIVEPKQNLITQDLNLVQNKSFLKNNSNNTKDGPVKAFDISSSYSNLNLYNTVKDEIRCYSCQVELTKDKFLPSNCKSHVFCGKCLSNPSKFDSACSPCSEFFIKSDPGFSSNNLNKKNSSSATQVARRSVPVGLSYLKSVDDQHYRKSPAKDTSTDYLPPGSNQGFQNNESNLLSHQAKPASTNFSELSEKPEFINRPCQDRALVAGTGSAASRNPDLSAFLSSHSERASQMPLLENKSGDSSNHQNFKQISNQEKGQYEGYRSENLKNRENFQNLKPINGYLTVSKTVTASRSNLCQLNHICQSYEPCNSFMCSHRFCDQCLTLNCCKQIVNFLKEYQKEKVIDKNFCYYCPFESCKSCISVPTAMIAYNYKFCREHQMFKNFVQEFDFYLTGIDAWIPYFDGLNHIQLFQTM